MAIVKVKYTRDPIKIKEHLRYIVHRPDKDRQPLTRELFDEFDSTDKARAYELIDATKHPLFFKIIINLDPKREDTHKDLDLQRLTRQTLREMQRLIGREVPFVATMHDDHTPLRHIHAIAMVQGKIAKTDFQKLKSLRRTATMEARSQRRERDHVREHPRVQFLTQARVLSQSVYTKNRDRPFKPLRVQHGCYHCGYGDMSGIPSWWNYCPSCYRPLKQEKTFQLELSRQL
jgi:rubrerythrin